MGKVADEAVWARRQRPIDGLIKVAATRPMARTDAGPDECRQRTAVAAVRRVVRTQRLARDAIVSADQQAAASIRILSNHGSAQSKIAVSCGVSLWTVRRLLALSQPTTTATATYGDEID
jgi:hypothetical protein